MKKSALGLKAGFLNVNTIDIGVGWFSAVESQPVHHRKFSNMPGLYPLDSSSTTTPLQEPTLTVTIKNTSRRCQTHPAGQNCSPLSHLRTSYLKGNGGTGYYLGSQIFANVTMGTMKRWWYFRGKGNTFIFYLKIFENRVLGTLNLLEFWEGGV